MPNCWREVVSALASVVETPLMCRVLQTRLRAPTRRVAAWLAVLASVVVLGGCTGGVSLGDMFSSSSAPSGPTQPSTNIGTGQVKVGLILPL
jgi:hypothetical protein